MASPPVELDPELAEKEEWEAAGLLAMEQYERTQRKQSRREREQHELQREEMQKKLRVEEVATKKAAANARKD